jgi:uncharacterized membrane protein YqaE (UPF0057 family)
MRRAGLHEILIAIILFLLGVDQMLHALLLTFFFGSSD